MKKENEERLKQLEKEIRRLTLDLLGPIAAKVVVKKAYDRYFEILDEIRRRMYSKVINGYYFVYLFDHRGRYSRC